jgi:hypothetical protein
MNLLLFVPLWKYSAKILAANEMSSVTISIPAVAVNA